MIADQARQVWEAALGQLQLQVTRPSYETWLKDTVGIAYRDHEFIVGTPNAFVAEMLEQRMYSLISRAMERVTQGQVDLRFQVMTGEPPASPRNPRTADEEPGTHSNGILPRSPLGRADLPISTHGAIRLNPGYTFDSFIVAKFNELAHAAATAVAERPGVTYNPLVLYSDVGLGKTHLLHAIGHRLRSAGFSVIYATTEEFTNEYITAIRDGKTEEFRNRYRSVDALLLDDIQFLIGKEETQEGFFHTFNALHMANRQIVITCDQPVTSLALLESRVRSRLAGGLVVDIQAPDLEARMAILRAKSEVMGQDLPPEVLQLLGERIHRNIRDLEGSLTRVIAYAQLTDTPITLDLARRYIVDAATAGERRRVSPATVLDAVAGYFQIDKDALQGPRGRKDVSLARQVAMYLMKEEANLGFTAIGRILGGRDHTTVLHGCSRVASRIDGDPHLHRDVLNIRRGLADPTAQR